MSCNEIRYWLKELHEVHGWSWAALARVCRLGERYHAASKVRGNSDFCGGEQARCSMQLSRIISGELVLGPPHGRGWKPRQDAVLADNPVPLKGATRLVFDMGTMKLRWVTTPIGRAPTLPSFRTIIDGCDK